MRQTGLANARSAFAAPYIDPAWWHLVTAGVLRGVSWRRIGISRLAATAPYISVVHVVIVGHAHRRNVTRQIAGGPAEDVPLAQVVVHRRDEQIRIACLHDPKAAYRFVNLVARPEQHVWFVPAQILRELRVRETHVPDAGQQAHSDFILSLRVLADRALKGVLPELSVFVRHSVKQSISRLFGVVPIRHAEHCVPGVGIQFGRSKRLPPVSTIAYL